MKFMIVAITLIGIVLADISELTSRYLPPGQQNPHVYAPAPALVEIPAPAPPPVRIPASVPIPTTVLVLAPVSGYIPPAPVAPIAVPPSAPAPALFSIPATRIPATAPAAAPIHEPLLSYIPPAAQPAPFVNPQSVSKVHGPEPAHVVADDGYRYKTVRRLKYRARVY